MCVPKQLENIAEFIFHSANGIISPVGEKVTHSGSAVRLGSYGNRFKSISPMRDERLSKSRDTTSPSE